MTIKASEGQNVQRTALAITLGAAWIDYPAITPLYLACLCLPVYAFQSVQDGIARCYNWVGVGQVPTFVIRPKLSE